MGGRRPNLGLFRGLLAANASALEGFLAGPRAVTRVTKRFVSSIEFEREK
jgi:hypothetical protein